MLCDFWTTMNASFIARLQKYVFLSRQLQVYRITMHKNLFFSLFLNAIVVLLFKSIVVLDEFNRSKTYETIMQKNGVSIQFNIFSYNMLFIVFSHQ